MTARTHLVLSLLAVALCCAHGRIAQAAGFALTEQSAEGIGMASAVSASTTEPAAVWYNPAALPYIPGYQASAFGILYLGQPSFSPRDGSPAVDAKPTRQAVPAFFATGRVSDRVGVGLGFYVPFGLGIGWPVDWIGREYGIKSSITTLNMNPVAAVKVLPNLSLAAGIDVERSAVDITNGLPAAIGGGTVRIGGGTWGVGGNAAVLYRALPERLHFSAAYHSRVKLTFAGHAHFEVNESVFTSSLFDQPGKATIGMSSRPANAERPPTAAIRPPRQRMQALWIVSRGVRQESTRRMNSSFTVPRPCGFSMSTRAAISGNPTVP